MSQKESYTVVISDCHLSAGRIFEGRLNAHEDFNFDGELCSLLKYFSEGNYGISEDQPVEVELFINGDFFDFLNVAYHGEFEDAITEELALYKLDVIFKGHPDVIQALHAFASLPGKKIRYLVGNHDAELFFPKVRERIIRAWDPEGCFPSEKVEIIVDRDRVSLGEGVEIHHGNQFEAVHFLHFDEPILKSFLDQPVLNIPWGSFYVLKIINRLKWEREFIDKVRPIKAFVLFGLVFDTWFTLKFLFISFYYFFKTRFIYHPSRHLNFKVTAQILKQETEFFMDLERQARRLLDRDVALQTIIFGHTHRPMHKIYPDGKQYINTGTWTKMINLDWRSLGQSFCLTFALIHRHSGGTQCELRRWVGDYSPHQSFRI